MAGRLDDDYAIGVHIPGGDAYPARWAEAAARFREGTRGTLDLAYGESPRQVVDIFYPDRLPLGVVVFVHGGYWLRFDKSSWSHLAAGAVGAGWAVAMPSYDLAPGVPVPEITRQIAAAVGFVAERVPGPIRLTGHSAGGHLVARMLDPGLRARWQARLARVVPIAPLADLRPLRETSMAGDLGLSAAVAMAESPVLQPAPEVPVTVWVGDGERPALIAQARALGAAWGVPVVEEPDRHHFDVIDGLTGGDLLAAVLAD